MIRTVTGDIAPEELGTTLSHEHLISTPPEWMATKDPDLVILDVDKAIVDVERFRAAGGQAMFEASAWDYGRDPLALKAIAERTGVKIIACGGFNKGLWFHERTEGWTTEQYEEVMVREVTEGIDGTDVRAGVIKFGTGYNSISEAEERVIRAACRAHLKTGAPMHSHTEAGTMALEQLEIVREEGVDPRCLTIAHLSRNLDPWLHRKVAESGAFVLVDQLSKVKYGAESGRLDMTVDLIDLGHLDQLLVGGDLARQSDMYGYSRGPGIGWILATWLPRLRERLAERGRTPEQIEEIERKLMVENPACHFAIGEPARLAATEGAAR
ncbi:phosphotriesterase family protein [Patulibacter sp. S7RM1-6]